MKGGVAVCLSKNGRRNGEALIYFENAQQRELALRKHRHHIGEYDTRHQVRTRHNASSNFWRENARNKLNEQTHQEPTIYD